MRALLLALATCVILSAQLWAGGADIETGKAETPPETPFDKGKLELQSSSGAYFSVGPHRPILNYSSTAYRLGLMIDAPKGNGFFRGNFEFMIQALGASVFDGPGNAFGSAAVIGRYNFLQPQSKLVPYLQIGAGEVYNDIYHDHSQRLVGQAWEFDLEAAIGVRYLLSPRWSIALEGGYRHISNDGVNDRNTGLNSLGVTAGLGYHF